MRDPKFSQGLAAAAKHLVATAARYDEEAGRLETRAENFFAFTSNRAVAKIVRGKAQLLRDQAAAILNLDDTFGL